MRKRERERERGGRLLKDCREKDRVLPLCRVVVVVVVVVVEFFCFALVFPKKMLNGHHNHLNGSSSDASHRLRREAKRALKKTGFTSRQVLLVLGGVVTVMQMIFAAKWLTSSSVDDDDDFDDATLDYSALDVEEDASASKLVPTTIYGKDDDGKSKSGPYKGLHVHDTSDNYKNRGAHGEETALDFWEKHFKLKQSVDWNDFAVILLMEHANDVKNLTAALAPAISGHFDANNDGFVSRKEYNVFLRKFGVQGMQESLQFAVDASLDNFWRRDPLDRRKAHPIGCAMYLDGQHTNHVELEASSDFHFNGAKPFAIEAWLKPHARPRNTDAEALKAYRFGGVVFSKYNRARRGQYFVQLEPDGHVFFHREVAPWGLRSTMTIPAGYYTHVAVTYGAGRSKIYINGTLRGSQREGAQAHDPATSVLIGAIHDQDKPASGFNGEIDELRVWNVDRTQTEIEQNMGKTMTGLEYGLLGYWPFDECSGWRARDKMGKHDAQLNGGRWVRTSINVKHNEKIVHCAVPGKCSIDEEEPRVTGANYIDSEQLRADYWKRAIRVMETQNRVNKKVIKELLMTMDTLTNRVRWLEKQDRVRKSQLKELKWRHGNVTEAIGLMRGNFTKAGFGFDGKDPLDLLNDLEVGLKRKHFRMGLGDGEDEDEEDEDAFLNRNSMEDDENSNSNEEGDEETVLNRVKARREKARLENLKRLGGDKDEEKEGADNNKSELHFPEKQKDDKEDDIDRIGGGGVLASGGSDDLTNAKRGEKGDIITTDDANADAADEKDAKKTKEDSATLQERLAANFVQHDES